MGEGKDRLSLIKYDLILKNGYAAFYTNSCLTGFLSC